MCDTRVLQLDRMGLLQLMHQHPEIMIAIARRFAQQRQRAWSVGPPRLPTAQVRVLLPVSADVPVLDVTARLAQEVGHFAGANFTDCEAITAAGYKQGRYVLGGRLAELTYWTNGR